MRVLILTCNTGGGHNSSATAIAEQFIKRGVPCETKDALALISRQFSDKLVETFIDVYRRMPVLWREGYRGAELLDKPLHITRKIRNQIHIPDEIRDKLSEFSRKYDFIFDDAAAKLYRNVRNDGVDTIICTHPFAAIIVTFLKHIYLPYIHTAFMATDYTCSPTVGDTDVDIYFIPHEGLREEFINAGIPESKIVVSGIAIRSDFYKKVKKREAKKLLGIPKGTRNIIFMSGSMGAGNLQKLAVELAGSLPKDCMLTVVCGSNKKLFDSMTALGIKNINVMGYTKDMPLIMDSADLLITKPGGLTSTEGAAKHMPMLFLDVVGGCEKRNIDYFKEMGWAEGTEKKSELIRICRRLLDDRDKLKYMKKKLRRDFTDSAAEFICKTMMSLHE